MDKTKLALMVSMLALAFSLIALILPGPQGDLGPEGTQGTAGIAGIQGLKGDVGDLGSQGPQGLQGLKGDIGSQGPMGPVGQPGPRGPEGFTYPGSVPMCSTLDASNIGATSATLKGYVVGSEGLEVSGRFQLGLTTELGYDTAWQSSFTPGSTFGYHIPGLVPLSTYFFRAQVKGASGSIYSGGIKSFILVTAAAAEVAEAAELIVLIPTSSNQLNYLYGSTTYVSALSDKSDSTYVGTNEAKDWKYATFRLDIPESDRKVISVSVYYRARGHLGHAMVGLRLHSLQELKVQNGSLDLSSDWLEYSSTFDTNPAGSAWDNSDLEDLQVVVGAWSGSKGGSYSYISEVWISVGYKE